MTLYLHINILVHTGNTFTCIPIVFKVSPQTLFSIIHSLAHKVSIPMFTCILKCLQSHYHIYWKHLQSHMYLYTENIHLQCLHTETYLVLKSHIHLHTLQSPTHLNTTVFCMCYIFMFTLLVPSIPFKYQ